MQEDKRRRDGTSVQILVLRITQLPNYSITHLPVEASEQNTAMSDLTGKISIKET
jgi:hypothetical protein